MSGRPYPEGVAKVVELLDAMAATQSELSQLIPQRDRIAARVTELSARASMDRDALKKALREMDVSDPGNYGWEDRIGWFLIEMRQRQP